MPIGKISPSLTRNADLSQSKEIQVASPLSDQIASQHLISRAENLRERKIPQEASDVSDVSHSASHQLNSVESTASESTPLEDKVFFQAIYKKDYSKARELISEGKDVNVVCKQTQFTALGLAVRNKDIEFVAYLLDKGADPNIAYTLYEVIKAGSVEILKLIHSKSSKPLDLEAKTPIYGYTPLILATRYGHKDIVEYLLSHEVSVDARSKKNRSALHYAAIFGQVEILKCLVPCVDMNSKGFDNRTPLMEAAIEGQTSVVEFLLSQKQEIDLNYSVGPYAFTALMYAIEFNRLEIVKLLVETGRINLHHKLQDIHESTPLLWASTMMDEKNIDEEILKYLLDQYALEDVDVRSFLGSAYIGNISLLEAFLSKGLDVNVQDKGGCSAISIATRSNKLEVIQYLISKGANPDIAEEAGYTALMLASSYGHKDIVEYLLSQGGSLKKTAESGRTAFHLACMKGQFEIVELLIPYLDDINVLDFAGRTPLVDAIIEGQTSIIQLLLSQDKIDVNVSSEDFRPLICCVVYAGVKELKLLLEKGVEDLNAQDNEGRTALYRATEKGHFECIQELLLKGADPNIANKMGHTPLSEICQKYDILWEQRKQIIEVLYRYDANLNFKSALSTPLLEAFYCDDSMKVVSLLLDLGADINLRATEGASVLSCAISMNRPDCVQELLTRGSEVNEFDKRLAKGYPEILSLISTN